MTPLKRFQRYLLRQWSEKYHRGITITTINTTTHKFVSISAVAMIPQKLFQRCQLYRWNSWNCGETKITWRWSFVTIVTNGVTVTITVTMKRLHECVPITENNLI
jgi:hypothetical protein